MKLIRLLLHFIFVGSYITVFMATTTIPKRVVSSLTQMLDIKPYAVLIAHRHHYNIDSIHNVKVISSGSFVSVDEYCITKRISGKPSQTVCVCDKNGVRCSYDIILN